MRKFYVLFSILISALAGAQTYTFVNSTSTYANLTGATSLNNGEVWDEPEYTLVLPFNFLINGFSTNTFIVGDSFLAVGSSLFPSQVISPSSMDLIDRGADGDNSLSPISYKIDGVVGSRIAKVEFNNVGSYNDDSLTMYQNFQVWMYETSNIIEFRYGPSSIIDPDTYYDGESGGLIGLTSIDGEDLSNTIFLSGNAEAPTTTTEIALISGTPSNGRMYRFIPTNLGQDQFSDKSISVYPNPTRESLTVGGLSDSALYNVYDNTAKLIKSGRISATENKLDVSNLVDGLYFIQVGSFKAIKFAKS